MLKTLDSVRQDLRDAARALRRSPGSTAWILASLVVGMAATLVALAFLITLLVGPFPGVAGQDRLARLALLESCGAPDCWRRVSSDTDRALLTEGLTSLRGLAAYGLGQMSFGDPEARTARGAVVSANYFDVLGTRPHAGRFFTAADEQRRAAVAVIAHGVWLRDFGGRADAIGRSIRSGTEVVEVVGVAPEFFVGVDLRPARGDRGPEVWVPLWLADSVLPLTLAERRRQQRDLLLVGRLRDGVELSGVMAEARVFAARAGEGRSGPLQVDVRRVWMNDPRNWSLSALMIMPVPILVLGLACLNAANLLLARGSQRQREIAVRLALGASRGRVVRQLVVESGVLALLATAAAIPAAWWILQVVSTPVAIPVSINATVLVLTVLVAALTTVAFGLAPAVRVSAQRPSNALAAGGGIGYGTPHTGMRRSVVAAQVALSIGLLMAAMQMVATVRAQAVSAGTPGDRLLIARFNLRDMPAAASTQIYDALLAGASRLPGVEAAGVARHTAVWTFGQGAAPASLAVWRAEDAPDGSRIVTGGYAGGALFDALGLRTIAGRTFTAADRLPRPQVAVVNRTFAESMAGSAVGSTIKVAAPGSGFVSALEVRIVGVIEPAVEPRLATDGPPPSAIYLPSPLDAEPALALYLRTRNEAAALAPRVRELAAMVAPSAAASELGTLDELNERSFGAQLWLARAAGVLGLVGLLLAIAGVYGVGSFSVAVRAREIAIRAAVGARRTQIVAMVVKESMRPVAWGLVAGSATAVVVSRVIQSEYHGIRDLDLASLAGAAALFVAAMLVASTLPALRAARFDPIAILKSE